ncbi:MAG: PDZ domain-containing protein [Candidatus Omnitrophica bacterium]|nr:PDZ domain-containing protein [Candidatus Omnitrophota bacterium]
MEQIWWRFMRATVSIPLLTLSLSHCLTSEAGQLPSVFRGVVVADSPVGVRVVSVDENSQAALADVRPDDIIVRVDDQELHSIDDFAAVSTRMKGRTTKAAVLVFRNGQPVMLSLHLFSYPILNAWGIDVLPDHDIRFAEPRVGFEYWQRLGNGFEVAGDAEKALFAYGNALHNVPTDTATAIRMSQLFCQVSERQFQRRRLREATGSLRNAVTLMQKLFEAALSDEQLAAMRDQLRSVVGTLKGLEI